MDFIELNLKGNYLIPFRCPIPCSIFFHSPVSQASATSDKADQASCAEVLAGLIAATVGAGATSSSAEASRGWALTLLNQALSGTTLELSKAWSVTARCVFEWVSNERARSCLDQ